ncbi:Uncharacterised protein [Vibrio cholerae]|nr:Uncharacterised protein [Vibrio cholerae]
MQRKLLNVRARMASPSICVKIVVTSQIAMSVFCVKHCKRA